MGLLVDGKWQDRWYRHARRPAAISCASEVAVPQLGHAGRRAGPTGAARLQGRARPLPPLCLARLPVGAPHADLSRAEEARGHHLGLGRASFHGRERLDVLAEDGATGDTLYGLDFLHQIYTRADPAYSGRVTVPVLWDKQAQTIVSNESSEIIRMLNSAFDEWGDAGRLLSRGAARRDRRVNALVYPAVNNGVYRAGFATTQAAYEEAFGELFAASTRWRTGCRRQRYLAGDRITEADWRLFTTLVRFDPVYVGHFKCNLRRIADYPNLSNYLRDLYQVPGVAETVNLHHIKAHYYGSHETINPTRIVPIGPAIDYSAPHDRGRFGWDALSLPL